MKFDTIIIALIVLVISVLFLLAKDYNKRGSFIETVEITLGLKQAENGPRPEETLVAPFADKSIKPLSIEERKNFKLPINNVPLTEPHKSVQNISEWLIQNVGNALILDKEKVSNLHTEIEPFFTKDGVDAYKEFGKNTNIFSAVFHGEDTILESYLAEQPMLINAGTQYGAYAWRFEIPMILNLVKGKLTQYKNTAATQQKKLVYFCVTVTRSKEAQNSDGVLISEWQSGRCK